jgi:hypothetical protein
MKPDSQVAADSGRFKFSRRRTGTLVSIPGIAGCGGGNRLNETENPPLL